MLTRYNARAVLNHNPQVGFIWNSASASIFCLPQKSGIDADRFSKKLQSPVQFQRLFSVNPTEDACMTLPEGESRQ